MLLVVTRVAEAFKSLTDYITSIPDKIIGAFSTAFDAVHDLIADSWVGSLLGMEKNNPNKSTTDNVTTVASALSYLNPFGLVMVC